MESRLRTEASTLLETAKVDYIVGFEPGSLKFTTSPLITRDKGDVNRLVVNSFMVNNLGVYLTELKGRVGVVAKGCDSRSIVSLIQDNKVAREDVVIIGIPCPGLIDLRKIEQQLDTVRDELDDIVRNGDSVIVTAAGKQHRFPTGQVLFDHCLGCDLPTPIEYDILLDGGSPLVTDQAASREPIAGLEAAAGPQRWQFWRQEFSRCIRCYACRNVCPACFCERCFIEETEPQWISPLPQWQDNLLFQVVRNIHVAGRCTDCDNCERACPVNIPLRRLTKRMYEIVDDLFHYRAGMDPAAAPLLIAYENEEAEGIFR